MSTLVKRTNTPARYLQLSAVFRERILNGTLPPGMRLPTELALAEEYQLSRGTVRQAMTTLVNEGLIERVQGRGMFVRSQPHVEGAAVQATAKRIGLVLNHAASQLDLDILIGVEHAAKSRGYQLSFAYSEENLAQQARDIERLLADRAAGVIIFPVSDVSYDESIWQLHARGVPFVLIDRYFPDLDCDYVVADNSGGAYRATEHLIILGHTRIGFVYARVGSLQTTSVRERWQGYRAALQDYGLTYDEQLLFQRPATAPSNPNLSYDEFLCSPDRSSAILAVNDSEALEVMRAARRCNLRIPEDLALVGFDDLSYAAYLNPPLTTTAQPRMDLGLRAGNLLINRIEGQIGPPKHIKLPTNLVIRESCGTRLRVRKPAV